MPPKLSFAGRHTECDATPALAAEQPAGSWLAGMRAHPIHFRYDTRTQIATVQAAGMAVDVRVKTRMGLVIEPWDLHVGAVVNVLGRHVTLHSADLAVRTRASTPCCLVMKVSTMLHHDHNSTAVHCSTPALCSARCAAWMRPVCSCLCL
jgi:hypothetical protein